jgi:PAS domain S-box-containing protein
MSEVDNSRRTTPKDSLAADPGLAIELCPLGLLLLRERCIAWCNDRFAADFGYTPGELIGHCTSMLYPSRAEYERIGDRGLKLMETSGEYRDERLMKRRDGLLQWFRVHGRALDRTRPFGCSAWVFEPLTSGADASQLTPREREVLAAISRGLTAKQCAKELGISPRTVEKFRTRLLERFGAHNAAELVGRISGMPG